LVYVAKHRYHRLVAVEGLLELLAREVVHAVEALDELPRPCGRGLLDEVGAAGWRLHVVARRQEAGVLRPHRLAGPTGQEPEQLPARGLVRRELAHRVRDREREVPPLLVPDPRLEPARGAGGVRS